MRLHSYLKIMLLLCLGLILTVPSVAAQESGYTQADREHMVRMETTQQMFMEQTNQRFEQVDKRFEELREDFNQRFEQLMTFLWTLAGIFTTLVIAVMGFTCWYLSKTIRKARDEIVALIENEGIAMRLAEVLRRYAAEDERMARALRACGML